MAGEAQEGNWPLPKFQFVVRFGSRDTEASFQEVSGLDTEIQPIEYRHGNSKLFSTVKMPGIVKSRNVTLKRGIFFNDSAFWNWYEAIKMNTIQRETVTIQLLDETNSPVMTWTLNNAWPAKISTTDIMGDANELAVETLELNHEGLTIKNGY